MFFTDQYKKKSSRPPGRPQEFDRDKILDRAVTTFWAKGYKDASLDDLTESMGINRPSLYATFGSKHDLFMEVIDRYSVTLGCRPLLDSRHCGENHLDSAQNLGASRQGEHPEGGVPCPRGFSMKHFHGLKTLLGCRQIRKTPSGPPAKARSIFSWA